MKAEVLEKAPADCLCMGNVDPAAVIAEGTEEEVTEATCDLMEKCGGYKNFIASTGCDVPAHAKWENIQAFFAAVEN